jgi:hypothetical protein
MARLQSRRCVAIGSYPEQPPAYRFQHIIPPRRAQAPARRRQCAAGAAMCATMARMVLVITVLAAAVIAGWVAGGRLRNLGHVRLRGVPLVFAAVGLQLALAALSLLDGPATLLSRPLLAASHVALLAFIAWNRLLPGMALVLVGFALNAAVIIPNGAMPVSESAYRTAGGVETIEPGKHRLLDDDDHLPWLADVIPIRPLGTVVSVGDIVLSAGVAVLVPSLMRRYPAPPGRRRRPRPRVLLGPRDPDGR